ncbi:hypothetical protein PPYR_08752 [Photinus pyralis]|uniref:Uncharacterized protein n=1 Tax=Photinus pyralis TaxID=7054 RepID=A0A1Y1M7S7_PHOPY|nr:flexible cuticle protein 12-like [Photinus pyralis]KAB0797759.1 hypothetical protein PPYR_08752 [Photinus pyralis]
MKTAVVILSVFAVALARPQQPRSPDADAQILKYNNENNGPEGYNFDFETSNQITRQEEGKLDNPQAEESNMRVVGSFSYPLPDGKTLKLTFTADENGYRPQFTIS